MKLIAFVALGLGLAALPAFAQNETYGTIRVTTKLRGDGTRSTTITDPDKRTAEETVTDAAGKTLQKTTYLLGEGNLSVGAIFSDAKGRVVYKASYKRNDAGQVTEASFNSPDDRYLGKRMFFYRADGQASQVIDYDANGQVIPQAAPSKSTKRRH